LDSVDYKSGAIAGAVAGLAYAAAMEVGMRVFNDNLDDLALLGWPLV
jgi:hypothetical protein